jgi:hypothetical protein
MSESKADDCACEEQKEEAKPDYLANIKRGPALHERECVAPVPRLLRSALLVIHHSK